MFQDYDWPSKLWPTPDKLPCALRVGELTGVSCSCLTSHLVSFLVCLRIQMVVFL